VHTVAIPRQGKISTARHKIEHSRSFHRLVKWRTWTKQAPAAHPSARQSASMAYDAATGNIVLFGGSGHSGWFSDTWTWGGSG
jgi:hypothetical protein